MLSFCTFCSFRGLGFETGFGASWAGVVVWWCGGSHLRSFLRSPAAGGSKTNPEQVYTNMMAWSTPPSSRGTIEQLFVKYKNHGKYKNPWQEEPKSGRPDPIPGGFCPDPLISLRIP